MYSSNTKITLLALKLVLKLGGKEVSNCGARVSLGPPVGEEILAHEAVEKYINAEARINTGKKRRSLFKGIILLVISCCKNAIITNLSARCL